jgi:hypothetical protein
LIRVYTKYYHYLGSYNKIVFEISNEIKREWGKERHERGTSGKRVWAGENMKGIIKGNAKGMTIIWVYKLLIIKENFKHEAIQNNITFKITKYLNII